MENEIMELPQQRQLTVEDLQTQITTIKKVIKSVMIEGVHYGKIPGCGDKPALFKPGAEMLMATFRLAAEYQTEDMSNLDEMRYRITTRITYAPTGSFLGSGVGEASTNEKKYKWRKAVCEEEFDNTPENMRQIHYSNWNGKVTKTQQVKANPADIANTVLKMAKKRSLVDAVLTVTGGGISDMFTQDIEDMDKSHFAGNQKQTTKQPRSKSKDKDDKPQGFTALVKHIYPKKDKAPCSATFEEQDGYYKSFDEDIEMSLQDAIDSKTKLNISFHVETKGQYSNNMIDSLSISED